MIKHILIVLLLATSVQASGIIIEAGPNPELTIYHHRDSELLEIQKKSIEDIKGVVSVYELWGYQFHVYIGKVFSWSAIEPKILDILTGKCRDCHKEVKHD